MLFADSASVMVKLGKISPAIYQEIPRISFLENSILEPRFMS